ncbi:MAG: glycoside hydrolase family 172 protein [Caldilineaceae bacterium]
MDNQLFALQKGSPLGGLARLRNCTTRRISSWDRTGGNHDWLTIAPGATVTLGEIAGAGCINHLWCTIACEEADYLRKIVLRAWWDDEETPSIEAPIGDFFGLGHATTRNFWSLPLAMSPEEGRGFNCFFPMPFARNARFELTNECSAQNVTFYYAIDYELYAALPEGLGRFHAHWRRQNPCDGVSEAGMTNDAFEFGGKNLTGEGNYVILDAEGQGHYVGCALSIHNLRQTELFNWYGEGDDMIFVDGEAFPPSLHGTGTEDYFNTAWSHTVPYSSPYHGVILGGGPNWSGQSAYYRFHIEDPVCFRTSIRVTVEHGHNNQRSDDYASTAYWYQTEPHKPFPPLLPVAERLPNRLSEVPVTTED